MHAQAGRQPTQMPRLARASLFIYKYGYGIDVHDDSDQHSYF